MKRRIFSIISLAVALALVWTALGTPQPALALNPPVLQTFYLTLPEEVMLQYLDENFGAPTSPVRSITSIAIGTNGTVVYYDQWEDGGYDLDITNPTNLYDAATNPAGNQIWGDGVIANGCPPSINNQDNPCTLAEHDQLSKGDVITLDNSVIVTGSLNSYGRDANQIYFDGRDKVGVSLPVAVTRSLWPSGIGSLVADAQSVLPTERWGSGLVSSGGGFVSPVGEGIGSNGSYDDVRWLIMADAGGASITVDVDGPGATAPFAQSLAEGATLMVDGIRVGATLNSDNLVQVTLLTAEPASQYENRFYNLIPRADWSNDYYTPVGTGAGNQCTNVWVYNPNASTITVNYRIGSGTPATFTVGANAAVGSANITSGNGARFWTTGSPAPKFLPISMTDCTNGGGGSAGNIFDWGNELYPADQLSPEILVGWAEGCSNEHPNGPYGVCLSTTGLGNTTNTKSRNLVWVTPLANTTLYVDLDGSGIACSATPVTGAEQTISATAFQSVRISNDPSNVRDEFDSQRYDQNGGGNRNATWASNWIEGGGEWGGATGGATWITGGALQFRYLSSTNETGRTIERGVNLSGMGYARLSFHLTGAGLNGGDNLELWVSSDGGANWNLLQTYSGNQAANVKIVDIKDYATANTRIRFRIAGDLDSNDIWTVDNVNIDFTAGDGINGTYDMTGAYIRTCDETLIAAAFGQAPDLSFTSDNEAMDLGMGVPPYGSQIVLTKSADATYVAPGGEVTYTYLVKLLQTFSTSVTDVSVVDDFCAPTQPVLSGSFNVGDSNTNNALDPGEIWNFTCTTRLYMPTTNTAIAYAFYNTNEPIRSAPAQDTVGLTSSIGDRVWLDEDGDGDQDAGEAGIPNVKVTLSGTDADGNPITRETYTDSNGRYLFTDLPPSNASGYTISLDTGTIPDGLEVNPTYDEDGIGTAHSTVVVLGQSESHLTADFGYNWASPNETNNNTGNGAIGDRVWIDADGDGYQDANEAGLAGAAVTLYHDPDGDGIFDTVYATTTTDASGNYIFDDLPVGTYVVGVSAPGYAQTGDPDQPGVACGTACDNRTTAPILLAPGDVYVNADFGYQPTGASNTIGDLIFLDANGDGNWDSGEPGIPGVSVALLDASGNVIATTFTDANGAYSFAGLPDGTYTVWVNDVDNILGNLDQTSTPDNSNNGGQPCGTCNNQNTVTVSGGAGNTFQDFGYAPPGHSSGEGLIGDTIWLDTDSDGSYTPGEGLEGVVVNLLDDTGQVIARTVTNKNGQYFFGELPAGDYTVDIDTNSLPNLPNAGYGLENFVDPDGGTPHRSVVTIGGSEPMIDLDQDFGYRYPTGTNTIGGTLWNDTNVDGVLDGAESGRFAGVTVALYDANGNLVAVTTTDADGDYEFTNLPDGDYTVDVTDDHNVLDGYWHKTGPNPGVNDNSQTDTYPLSVSGGASNYTADFGYNRKPADLGDRVWLDRGIWDNSGTQDLDEPGIYGVKVTLTVNYPGGGTATVVTYTDRNGNYSFDNLLSDEDQNYADATAGTPTFVITFETPPGTIPSKVEVGGDPANDSNGASTTVSSLHEGDNDESYDSGFWTDRLDLGDLPLTYPTLFSPGPAHIIFPDTDSDGLPNTAGTRPAVWLGNAIDLEPDGQPSTNANGDGADEDGLTFAATGWTAIIRLNSDATNTRVYYGLWIDWGDGEGGPPDGTFDDFYSGSELTSSPVDVIEPLTVPGYYVDSGDVYIRLRAADLPLTEDDYVGTWINGEVEDYLIGFGPTAVEMISLDARTSPAGLPAWAWLSGAALLAMGGALTWRTTRTRR